jgi:CelD/BcsL family acetyltransferase involved in cellulose biosynthesis
MRTQLITTGPELHNLRSSWGELHHAARGSIFQTHEWLTSWWREYGSSLSLRVLTGWNGHRLVGLFPCFVQEFAIAGIGFRRLSLLGEYAVTGEYAPLVHPDHQIAFAQASSSFCDNLLARRECDFVDFHLLPTGSRFVSSFLREMQEREYHVLENSTSLSRTLIPLPSTWNAFLQTLGVKERKNLKRQERQLASRGVACEVLTTHSGFEEGFEDFVQLHSTVWRRKGEGGYFKSRPGFRAFHETVTAQLIPSGKAKLYFLTHERNRIAALQVFSANQQCHFYLSGRDPGHPLSRYAPGVVLMARAVRDAIEEGCLMCDLLEGEATYKIRMGGTLSAYARATIWPRRLPGGRGDLFAVLLRARMKLASRNRLPRVASSVMRLVDRVKHRSLHF